MKYKLVKKELAEIADANGGILRPHDVVEYAKDESTLLHQQFTWDDTEAAHQYRLQQARQIIRVTVNIVEREGENMPIKAYVSLKTDRYNGGGYRPMISVMSSADMRDEMLAEALDELKAFHAKYESLNELCEVFASIKKVARKHRKSEHSTARAAG